MSRFIFDRDKGETDAQYVLRLYQDQWFEDATPAEIADFAGLPGGVVRRVLFAWVKSSNVRRIHSHATSVAEQTGWSGTSAGLIHLALELYAQRAEKRDAVPYVPIEEEIEHFLARNRVNPGYHAPDEPDTDPGN
jgi:hypothetical protein